MPDDRTVVVERFRDEIGDWRVCVLSPFGTPVHAPWAMAIERRLSDRYDMAVRVSDLTGHLGAVFALQFLWTFFSRPIELLGRRRGYR